MVLEADNSDVLWVSIGRLKKDGLKSRIFWINESVFFLYPHWWFSQYFAPLLLQKSNTTFLLASITLFIDSKDPVIVVIFGCPQAAILTLEVLKAIFDTESTGQM